MESVITKLMFSERKRICENEEVLDFDSWGIFFNQKILCHVSARRTIAETVEFM